MKEIKQKSKNAEAVPDGRILEKGACQIRLAGTNYDHSLRRGGSNPYAWPSL